ncbi:MAG TPA: hypothetical protein VF142_07990, partial [Longimicrobium sp.]
AAGCAPAATGTGGPARGDYNVLTRDQMTAVDAGSLYDVVNRLRPRWLQVRGGQSMSGIPTDIMVFQNQTNLGTAEVLRQLPANTAACMRFLDGPTATATLPGLGSRHVAGAIVIHTADPTSCASSRR